MGLSFINHWLTVEVEKTDQDSQVNWGPRPRLRFCFKMKNFSSVFQGNPRPHVSFLNRFCPSTQKHNSDWKRDHLWWEHAHLLVSEPNLSYLVHGIDWIKQSDVIVFNTSVFIHPHEYSTTAFSKISAPESVFWEDAFSVTVSIG